jgi:hypothetical protein
MGWIPHRTSPLGVSPPSEGLTELDALIWLQKGGFELVTEQRDVISSLSRRITIENGK